jgi:hypothetical protein
MSGNNEYMKCAFCAWQTRRFITVKGKRKSGTGRLYRHVERDHPEEYEKIMERLEVAFPIYLRPDPMGE